MTFLGKKKMSIKERIHYSNNVKSISNDGLIRCVGIGGVTFKIYSGEAIEITPLDINPTLNEEKDPISVLVIELAPEKNLLSF